MSWRVPPRLASWVAPVAAVLLVAVVAVPTAVTASPSPFDEHTHFDYAVKIAQDLSIPPENDLLGQTALQELACSGEEPFAGLTCGAAQQVPERAPWQGVSSATSDPPTYYLLNALILRAIVSLPGDQGWFVAGRLADVLFLLVMTALLAVMVRRLTRSDLAGFAGAVLTATAPLVLYQFTTITNDSLAMTMSVLVVWLWMALSRRRRWVRLLAVYALALVALTVKETAIVAALAVTALEAFRARVPEPAGDRTSQPATGPHPPRHEGATRGWPGWARAAGAPALGLVTTLAVYVVAVQQLIPAIRPDGPLPDPAQTPPGMLTMVDAANASTQAPLSQMMAQVADSVLVALRAPEGPLAGDWWRSYSVLLAAIAFGAAVLATMQLRTRTLGVADVLRLVLVGFVVVGPVLSAVYLQWRGLPQTYGARWLLPAMVLLVPLLLVGLPRWSTRLVASVAVVFAALSLVQVLTW